MDVEVMVHDAQPKVLEIDARLPSQTPTAVFWSSGLNIVELLHRTARDERVPDVDRAATRACVFQHVHAFGGRLVVTGEHVMGDARPLDLVPGFFGAHEALTDYMPGRATWSATLITLGDSVREARGAADDVVAALAAEEHLELLLEGESR
jgi:pyrrolysine biosynthesis protein PylC